MPGLCLGLLARMQQGHHCVSATYSFVNASLSQRSVFGMTISLLDLSLGKFFLLPCLVGVTGHATCGKCE